MAEKQVKKIQLIRACIVNGKAQKKGAKLTVSSRDARLLIGTKKAVAVKAVKKETAEK